MAFKPEVDAIRASLSYKLKKSLLLYCSAVLTTDPLVKNDPDLLPLEEVVERSDILVVCTPHKVYKNLDTKGKPMFDVWNFVEGGSKARENPSGGAVDAALARGAGVEPTST